MRKNKTNCGIYQVINLIPNKTTGINKVYIGSSYNLCSRKNQHFNCLQKNCHKNKYLQNAYNKLKEEYGEEVKSYFKWEVIKEIEKYEDKEKLKEELLKWEQYYIDEYKDKNGKIDKDKCYNNCLIAGSTLGIKYTERAKEKLRLSHTGNKHSEETKEKIIESRKWYKHSEETKEKISLSNKNKITSEETKEKIRMSLVGKKHSEKRNKEKSNRMKGKNNNFYGKHHTEETKEKIKNSNKEHLYNLKLRKFKKVINLTTGKEFKSIKEASEFYSIKSICICNVCKNRQTLAGGYRWAYI